MYTKPGLYCCDIITFNTIALKGAVRDVCRGFWRENVESIPEESKKSFKNIGKKKKGKIETDEKISDKLNDTYKRNSVHKEVPYEYIAFASQIADLAEKDEEAARKKYPTIFKYVDLVMGCVVSVGNHPAGVVVSPFTVDDWFGTFTTSTNEYPISQINMKEIDALNFVKLN